MLVPMNFKVLIGNFDPWTAFLHPFCRSTAISRNQSTDIADSFPFRDDPRLGQHLGSKFDLDLVLLPPTESSQRSKSSNCVAASVFSSRYFTITGAYNATPHSRPFSVCTARAPGTTTAPAGISKGDSPVRRYVCSRCEYGVLVNHSSQTGSRPLDWQLCALVQSQIACKVRQTASL